MGLCAPALIYLIFSIIQILLDMLKGLYNTALMKFIVMIVFTLLLNILCMRGLGIISWIIVFIPFILMSIVVTLLLYILGLKATSGKTDSIIIPTEPVLQHELPNYLYSSSHQYESFTI